MVHNSIEGTTRNISWLRPPRPTLLGCQGHGRVRQIVANVTDWGKRHRGFEHLSRVVDVLEGRAGAGSGLARVRVARGNFGEGNAARERGVCAG